MENIKRTKPEINFASDHPLRLWIEQELGRKFDDLTGIKVEQDMERDYDKEQEMNNGWMYHKTGDIHYRATFADGSTATKTIKRK